jgi:lysophospholipase L1-like esterase
MSTQIGKIMIQRNDIILFQGDSITDVGRDRQILEANNRSGLGPGYVHHTAAFLLSDLPDLKLTVYNRGIGGNRITDMAQRWRPDCLDLNPNILSILIGVNDTWHGQDNPQNGVPLEQFDRLYRDILDESLAASSSPKLILGQPFALRCGAVTDNWYPEFTDRQAIVEQIARDYNTVFVPYQQAFETAAADTGPEYWTTDGVHPTTAGHMLMARTWIQTVCGQHAMVPADHRDL